MMPHIALITTSYPERDPGSEAAGAFVADFAEALARRVKVTVLAPSLEARIEEQAENLSVWRFAVPALPLSLLRPGNPAHWAAICRTLLAGGAALRRLLREHTIDHIFALWALPSGYWARNARNAVSIPYSVWALGSDIWSLSKVPVVKNLLRNVLRSSHACFADGYLLQRDVELISGRTCHFLPSSRKLPAVATKQLAARPPYKLAFLGRWHPNKGVDLLLDSLGLLSDKDWEKISEVRICGGGPLEQHVRHACSVLLEARRPVTLAGYLGRNEAAQLYAWADYVVLPSRIESIPVVFSDAMQSGCPVICTPVGDLPRLIAEYRVGLVAEQPSPQSFCKALQQALAQSPLSFENNLRAAASAFDIDSSVLKFLEAINEA